ncbi:ABC transporter ATP-binding protein [Alkalicoccobacillus murimartini]|uniref:Peptide/nickel transport system ATP-binding protein n=1 Tax=Alkalicoccobacillus murimartini TaxID=171685 RepID=A0ABT9YFZ9_9BACI|nr:ABC transporter ATP-binding protein [Alkalicoccobacillus murimartini]MDQ0206782.1 peptide/nickel transport system ATP-binding protein [Alkalicoccobacillus murimartini]
MSEPLLEVKHLKTYFEVSKTRTVKAVDDVSFQVNKGETLAVVGESGSGKSVTSLTIMGLLFSPPANIQGSVKLDGHELIGLSDKKLDQIRGNEMSMIFQEPMTSLNPVFTIGNQIAETLIRHKKVSKKEAKLETVRLLKLVGFGRAEDMLKEFPHQLSGGMRQRVMIAIAMACNPKLLIADEPTTALDVTIQQQILDLMLKVKEEFHSSILLITHDLGVVAEMADRVLVMYAGQVVEEATAYELFTNPKHPYTVGLLNSMPKIDDEQKERLDAIPGVVPAAHRFPQGCRFAPRCPHASDECTAEMPSLMNLADTRAVRCVLYKEEAVSV